MSTNTIQRPAFVYTDENGEEHEITFNQLNKDLKFKKKNVLRLEHDDTCDMCRYAFNQKVFFMGNDWDYHLALNAYECQSLQEVETVIREACDFWQIDLQVIEGTFDYNDEN